MFLFVLLVAMHGGCYYVSTFDLFFFLGVRVNLPHPSGMEGCGVLNEMAKDSLYL